MVLAIGWFIVVVVLILIRLFWCIMDVRAIRSKDGIYNMGYDDGRYEYVGLDTPPEWVAKNPKRLEVWNMGFEDGKGDRNASA